MTNTKDCPDRRYPLLNKVMFIGRLVRDCDVKYLESGTQLTHFSVALDGAGNRGTEAAFIDFSKIGEFNVAEYLKKGTQVFVEGHIDQARKEVDGQKRTFTNLVELQQVFPSADLVGNFVVFNIGGNKYRLIAYVDFEFQKVFIRHVLTHAEYDKEKWKRNDRWFKR